MRTDNNAFSKMANLVNKSEGPNSGGLRLPEND